MDEIFLQHSSHLQYSVDGRASWNTANTDTYSWAIHIDRNQTLYLKGNNPDGWSHSSTKYWVKSQKNCFFD